MIEVFRAHDVGYFLYIGGNDSMDTANKIAELAHQRGLDLVGIGVPKTIDNDVGDSEVQADRPHARLRLDGQVLDARGAERQRGERRLLPGRSGAGAAGHGPQDRLHSGRRPAGRSGAARCRCRSTWPKAPARWSNWPTTSTINCGATAAASW